MPHGEGYSKADLSGARAKLEALARKKKKKGRGYVGGSKANLMDKSNSKMTMKK